MKRNIKLMIVASIAIIIGLTYKSHVEAGTRGGLLGSALGAGVIGAATRSPWGALGGAVAGGVLGSAISGRKKKNARDFDDDEDEDFDDYKKKSRKRKRGRRN